jgi:hypothetical protein
MLGNLSCPPREAADLPLAERLRFHWLARERWQDKMAHLLRPRLLLRAYRYERRNGPGTQHPAAPGPGRHSTRRTLSR